MGKQKCLSYIVIELGYCKIFCFLSVTQISYLPQSVLALANNQLQSKYLAQPYQNVRSLHFFFSSGSFLKNEVNFARMLIYLFRSLITLVALNLSEAILHLICMDI